MATDELSENAVEVLLSNRLRRKSTSLVCLNFKVPLQVRLQFKICAAQHDMTMTDLLLKLIEDFLTANAKPDGPTALIKERIKK